MYPKTCIPTKQFKIICPGHKKCLKITCLSTPHFQPSRPHFLIIDATNILSRASKDSRRWSHVPGHSLTPCFNYWLEFLSTSVQPTQALIAIFDDPEVSSRTRQSLETKYQERRAKKRNNNTNSGKNTVQNTNYGKLTPIIKTISLHNNTPDIHTEKTFSLVAQHGFEADDVIGSVCSLLSSEKHSIIIASGDTDMQQYLGFPNTSWLELLPLPTATHPTGIFLHTKESFMSTHKFSPDSYSDYLSLIGKKGSGIGGVGLGAGTAASLLAQYKTIEEIQQAAAAGKLKGWGPNVNTLFQPGSIGMQKLMRNRKIFFRGVGLEEKILSKAQLIKINQLISKEQDVSIDRNDHTIVADNISSSSNISDNAHAWIHPYHAARWKHARQCAGTISTAFSLIRRESKNIRCTVYAALAYSGKSKTVHASDSAIAIDSCRDVAATPKFFKQTENGIPIDILVRNIETDKQMGILLCCKCDFEKKYASPPLSSLNPTIDFAWMLENIIMAYIQTPVSSINTVDNENDSDGDENDGVLKRISVYDPCSIKNHLNPVQQHHISVLRKTKVPIVLIPYYII